MLKKTLKNLLGQSKLVDIYRLVRDHMKRYAKPVQTQWGFSFSGNLDMASGGFEPNETQLIRRLLLEVDVFINIGANVGYYCCHALSLGKKIIAFEPLANNLQHLQANIKRNSWSQLAEIFPIALSDASGVSQFWGGDTGASLIKGWAGVAANHVTLVPTNTLDRMLGNSIDGLRSLILVDVEGSELNMLRGALKTLGATVRPIWLVEIVTWQNQPVGTSFNPDFTEIFDIFFTSGYRAYIVGADCLDEITQEHITKIVIGNASTDNYMYLFR